MSAAGAAETRRAGAARSSAADARQIVLRHGYKEAAE